MRTVSYTHLLISAGSPAGQKFRASGRLVGGGGTTCTATVVHGSGKPDPGQKALILSNGHCVSDTMRTNEVVVDQAPPASEEWTFTPAYFHDNTAEHKKVAVERVVYATMKGIDVSVLRLSATYGELAALNVTSRTLAAAPAPGTPLQAAHAPTDGVEEGKRFLRLSTCAVTASSVALHEYTWLWRDFNRTDHRGHARIPRLRTGSPLRGRRGGADRAEGRHRLRHARRRRRLLPRERRAAAEQAGLPPGPRRAGERRVLGEADAVHHARGPRPVGRARHARRRRAAHVRRLQERPVRGHRLHAARGVRHACLLYTKRQLYVLCAAGGPDGTLRGARWAASLAHPSYAFARVDNTPPTVAPKLDVQRFDGEQGASYWVRPVYAPWELSMYKVKYGPKATTDCADPQGYRPYLGIPTTLKASEGPWTYCAIGYDNADNATAPATFPIA